MLQSHYISHFKTYTGYSCPLNVTYQIFGESLGSAPVVLVNHALTGNSTVTGDAGWWSDLIGPAKAIDTNCFTVLAIDIPGNGYDRIAQNMVTDYKEFHVSDIARIQLEVINFLDIETLFAVIGGSLGGQIAWELAIQIPNRISHLIPVATDWKATDWVIAQCHIQDSILNNSRTGIEDARKHAMTFYRTPASFKEKFNRSKQEGRNMYAIESWLRHHGKRLRDRYDLSTYKLMNHLLGTADITKGATDFKEIAKRIRAQVHLVAIDTDGLFLADEIYDTYQMLQKEGVVSSYAEIHSIHGHDAFLIEYEQLEIIVKPIFQKELCHK